MLVVLPWAKVLLELGIRLAGSSVCVCVPYKHKGSY